MGEPISPSPEDLQGLPEEALTGLIAKGRAQGSLTDAEVFFAFPDVEPSPAQIEAIFTHIRACGIPVEEISADLESEDDVDDLSAPATAPSPAATTNVPPIPIPLIVPVAVPEPVAEPEPVAAVREPMAKARRAPRPEPTPGENVRPDRVGEGGVSDPVRMYLKEIGKVPLLTGPQEVSLAQRIEQGLLASDAMDVPNGELSPDDKDDLAYEQCSEELSRSKLPLPTLELKDGYNTRQVLNYGYRSWRQFFNDRQLLALGWLHAAILELPDDAVRAALRTVFSGVLEFNNMFASYKGEGTGAIRHMFAHHILKPERVPIEGNVWGTSKSSGSFSTLFKSRLLRAIEYHSAPFELEIERTNGRSNG